MKRLPEALEVVLALVGAAGVCFVLWVLAMVTGGIGHVR
jgi:hypothetical protein